jgi:hypothetical protein
MRATLATRSSHSPTREPYHPFENADKENLLLRYAASFDDMVMNSEAKSCPAIGGGRRLTKHRLKLIYPQLEDYVGPRHVHPRIRRACSVPFFLTHRERRARGRTSHDNGPWLTRVSLRNHFPEAYKHFDLGFRVVREKH